MPDQDPVVVADRKTLINGPIAQVIFFHPIEEVLRIVPGFFENRTADGMGSAGEIGGIEMRPVFLFGKSFVWKGIDLQLTGGMIIDRKGGNADGGVAVEDGCYGRQGVVVADKCIIIEKDQDGRPAEANAEVAAPGDA